MEIHLAEQTASFIYAAVLGLCLGGVYDFLRCFRMLAGGKGVVTAACDLLYSTLCMLTYFVFSLTFSGGVLRLYTAMSTAMAMLLYFIGISPLLMGLLMPVICLVRKGTGRAARFMSRGTHLAGRHLKIWFAPQREKL